MSLCKNKYSYRARISESKFRQLAKYFCLDFDATRTAVLTGLSRITVNRYFMAIRKSICENSVREKILSGSVELDESYFGARRIKGKRGRGAGGKTIVFGLLHRGGNVYTSIVPDAKKDSLLPIVENLVNKKRTTIYTDSWRSYNSLSAMGYKHRKVNHGANEFATSKKCHVNSIESYWAYSKRRLAKFCGVGKYLSLHLSECEFRFNNRTWHGMYKALLKMFVKFPLFFKGTPSKLVSAEESEGDREVTPILKPVKEPDTPQKIKFSHRKPSKRDIKLRSFANSISSLFRTWFISPYSKRDEYHIKT